VKNHSGGLLGAAEIGLCGANHTVLLARFKAFSPAQMGQSFGASLSCFTG